MNFNEILIILMNTYQFLNYDNNEIILSLKKIYKENDIKISKSKIVRFYRKQLKFKYSQKTNIHFWLERGFSEQYSISQINKISLKISNSMKTIKKKKKEDFFSYEEAKIYIQKLNIKTKDNYHKIKRNIKLPSNPDKFYTEWENWSMFLTNINSRNSIQYYSYIECRKVIKDYNINSKTSWFKNIHMLIVDDKKIPFSPSKTYKNEWISWGDFLSTNKIQDNKKIFLSFNDSKKFLKDLNINSTKEWRFYCKNKPDFIHHNPKKKYDIEFLSMSEYLGGFDINHSHGERDIIKFLVSNSIIFVEEKRFDDCRNILPLPFDFYLPEYNICIEFDGKQHFESISYWGGDDGLINRQHNDNIKNNYCYEKNIELIRIRYDEKINDKLKKLKKQN